VAIARSWLGVVESTLNKAGPALDWRLCWSYKCPVISRVANMVSDFYYHVHGAEIDWKEVLHERGL
jgi:hypothetical protein